MSHKRNEPFKLKLDLLHPQSNPEKIWITFTKWLLSTGRYILVFVELLVLTVFLSRFKLDADLASTKEAIENQIPYIESLKPYELLIRQTQLKLSTIKVNSQNSADYINLLKEISDKIPNDIKISNITITKDVGKITIKLKGRARNNLDLNSMINAFKKDENFKDVILSGVGLDEGAISFNVTATSNAGKDGGKKL
ncbi:PilN domain-containing protein [Candidatus Daviesbacteria bacterium]|nr:PilN domain-containing protein [Candidatus Daviesbacteria bacterium]